MNIQVFNGTPDITWNIAATQQLTCIGAGIKTTAGQYHVTSLSISLSLSYQVKKATKLSLKAAE